MRKETNNLCACVLLPGVGGPEERSARKLLSRALEVCESCTQHGTSRAGRGLSNAELGLSTPPNSSFPPLPSLSCSDDLFHWQATIMVSCGRMVEEALHCCWPIARILAGSSGTCIPAQHGAVSCAHVC